MDAFDYFDMHFSGAFSLAVRGNNVEILQRIVDEGADPCVFDNRGYLPMHEAAKRGYHEVVRILLRSDFMGNYINAKTHQGETCIFLAAESGHDSVIRLLAESSGAINTCNTEGETPLHVACREGHSKCVNVLLEYNASCFNTDRYNGSSPLHVACEHNKVKCIELLVAAGGPDLINLKNDFDVIALVYTLLHHDMVAMKMLILEGSEFFGRDSFKDPFAVCCARGSPEMIDFFVKAGANLDWGNGVQLEPMEYIIKRGDSRVLQVALNHFDQKSHFDAYRQVMKTFSMMRKECVTRDDRGFGEALDFMILHIKKHSRSLGPKDIMTDVVENAKDSRFLLDALWRKQLLDLELKVGVNNTLADVIMCGPNPKCWEFVVDKMAASICIENDLYAKGLIYIGKILQRFDGTRALKDGVEYNTVRSLLRYITPQRNLSLLTTFCTAAARIPDLIELLIHFDIHEGLETWALYKELATGLQNNAILKV